MPAQIHSSRPIGRNSFLLITLYTELFMSQLSPLSRYEHDLNSKGFQKDEAQRNAVINLQRLYDDLLSDDAPKGITQKITNLFSRQRPPSVKGLYFWGGVGRGKTYLMDLFYDALPFDRKLRTHFHRFMRSVHHELKQIKNEQDPLEIISEKFARKYRVICFDEFFVVDITDAMILANLLDGLFRRGVCLVATSNIVPEGLYKDGLQRARFIPAIKLLEEHCEVLNVDGGVDYRLRTLKQSELYYCPHSLDAQQALDAFFHSLLVNEEHVNENSTVEIEGRELRAVKLADDVVWFDFYEICDGPRSQNDYIEIAREYHAVIVSDVPKFVEGKDDQARRFIYLVDEFYDRNVKLILSAAAPFMSLYESGRLEFEFQRTQSRLQEMQSEEYLALPHKG